MDIANILKKLVVMAALLTAAGCPATRQADAATLRLALWVTDSIGTSSGEKCIQAAPPTDEDGLPTIAPTLTEQDVIAWSADNASWTLNSASFANGDARQKLLDHCFVLTIDGKQVSSGVILSSYSARLTRYPTIIVYDKNHSLSLQLTSGNRSSHRQLLHVDELEAVLGRQ